MPRPKSLKGMYSVSSIWVRNDLKLLSKTKKWNHREILEQALLAKVSPEDLAYVESVRLEKELEEKKKLLEKAGEMRI